MSARRLVVLFVGVVAAASGAYLLVYLFRWEWNRALVSGVFFVAAELALAAILLLRRLAAVDQRLQRLEGLLRAGAVLSPAGPPASGRHATDPDPPGGALDLRERSGRPAGDRRVERIHAATVPHEPPFAWLRDLDGLGVFVPVLMGAGVLLSALAYVVERVAGATAVPALERSLAGRLDALALPEGGLVPDRGAATPVTPLTPPAGAAARARLRRGVAVAVVGLVLVGTIDVLADATQTRPERAVRGHTHVELSISHRDRSGSAVRAGEAYWVACRGTLDRGATLVAIGEMGPGRMHLTVSPVVGELARRRFEGCLEDLTFDGALATASGWLDVHRPD